MARGAPSESPDEHPSPVGNALKKLGRRITRTKSGELRVTRGLKTIGGKIGKGILKAPGAGIRLAKKLGKNLKDTSN